MKVKREGFFYSKSEPNLPRVKHKDKGDWKGIKGSKKALLNALSEIQNKARKRHYKGWADCRCCKANVGSTEYEYKGWVWPEGLMHYILMHNYRPSDDFIEEVLGIGLPTKLAPISEAIKNYRLGDVPTVLADELISAVQAFLSEARQAKTDKKAFRKAQRKLGRWATKNGINLNFPEE